MIQRIQSVFLLVAALLLATLFKLNFYTAQLENSEIRYTAWLHQNTTTNEIHINLIHIILQFAIIGFTLYTIFSYKNRKKQIKLAAFNILLICGFIVLMFYSYDNAKSFLDRSFNSQGAELSTTYGIGMILPLLSLVFNFLAIKGIRKDEELIKSADRIR